MDKPVILVVDDEDMARMAMRLVVETECGCTVFEAKDGFEASKILKQEKIDLVLLDIMMPELDGMELLSHMKYIALDEDIAVIMVTAMGEVSTAVTAMKKGAYDYIVKPYANEALTEKVKNALADKELKKEVREKAKRLKIPIIGERLEIQQQLEKAVKYIGDCEKQGIEAKDEKLARILGHTSYRS